MEKVGQYSYRKEFGLSYKEFINEPLEDFQINSEIMGAIASIQKAQARHIERKSK